MHRSWLVVAALALVGCFRPDGDSNGQADAGIDGTGSGDSVCGNGVIETGEQCEATPVLQFKDDEDCFTATAGARPNGLLDCNTNCTFNISLCSGGGMGGIGGVGGVGGG